MNRRKTLKLLGASAATSPALGLVGCGNQTSTLLTLNPQNPEHLHLMHRKLAYTLDDRLVYWNIDAVRMGFKDGILTPFWNMHVGIIYKIINISDFRYEVKAILKIFYTDLKTRKLLKVFDNPYTGEQRIVAQPRLFRSDRVFGLSGVENPEKQPDPDVGPTYSNDKIGPAWVIGDDIWLNADSIKRAETPNKYGQLLQVNDWSTYHGSMREVSDPNIKSASATHNFNDLNTFNHSWIGMKGVKAWSVSRGFGRKSHDVNDMPSEWRTFVSKTHPELLTANPGF